MRVLVHGLCQLAVAAYRPHRRANLSMAASTGRWGPGTDGAGGTAGLAPDYCTVWGGSATRCDNSVATEGCGQHAGAHGSSSRCDRHVFH